MEEKLIAFIEELNSDEKRILKNSLSRQIEYFFDEDNHLVLNDQASRNKFNLIASSLKKLGPHSDAIPQNGVAYYGRPEWLQPELLIALILEGQKRRLEPLDKIDHFLGCGGETADRLSTSEELNDFVRSIVGPISSTGIASYIYYDKPGTGIRPHVDTDVFSINMMIMLKHNYKKTLEPSSTVLFPAYDEPQAFQLQVGEVMIMYGSSVIHTRTIIQEGETVHLLTIGFNLQ